MRTERTLRAAGVGVALAMLADRCRPRRSTSIPPRTSRASPSASPPAQTATCGSSRRTSAGSDASRRAERSPSSQRTCQGGSRGHHDRSRRQPLVPPSQRRRANDHDRRDDDLPDALLRRAAEPSRSAPTGTCGSRRTTPIASDGSPRPGVVTEFSATASEHATVRNHCRARREPVVHRVRLRQHRTHHARGSHHRVRDSRASAGRSSPDRTACSGTPTDVNDAVRSISVFGVPGSTVSVPSRCESAGADAGSRTAISGSRRELGDTIGRMTVGGKMQEFALPAGAQPREIVESANGDIWFTMQGANSIGRLVITSIPLN